MNRRGAILFELLVSIVIFIAAAAITLRAVSNGYENLRRAHQRQLAVDLARSKLAELEAGLISITQMQSDFITTVGSLDLLESASDIPRDDDLTQWRYEVDSGPSSYSDLTLVEVRIYTPDDVDGERPTVLRQLIRLRDPGGFGDNGGGEP